MLKANRISALEIEVRELWAENTALKRSVGVQMPLLLEQNRIILETLTALGVRPREKRAKNPKRVAAGIKGDARRKAQMPLYGENNVAIHEKPEG